MFENFTQRFSSNSLGIEDTVEKELEISKKGPVLNKTISSNVYDKTKVIVDNLDSDGKLETDVLRQKEELKEAKAKLLLPLYRFESTLKDKYITYIKDIVNTARVLRKDKNNAKWLPIMHYLKIIDWNDIAHLVNLAILRNKNAISTEKKNLEIEVITCFFEKKMRVKYDIPEDRIIQTDNNPEYAMERKNVINTFRKFFNSISEQNKLKQSGVFKDIEVNLVKSEGNEDYGSGLSITVSYNKDIDYQNWRRGKEGYDGYEIIMDDDKKRYIRENLDQSIEDDVVTGEQNNINNDINNNFFSLEDEEAPTTDANSSGEPTGDGEDTENAGDDDEQSDDPVDDFAGDESDENVSDDSFGGDSDDSNGEQEGGDDSSGGDYGGDSGSNETKKSQPGLHPFAELNGKHKVIKEFKELVAQINRITEPFKNSVDNPVISKLEELRTIVDDAIGIAFTVNIEDSLLRYSLYVTQYEELVIKLKEYLSKTKPINKN
jgi:hypothetical protein